MNFPLPELQATSAANPWSYLVFIVIGFAFGYVLEIAGFGNSKKLAAQFYFTELTVLKVMFGAIVTAMVLIFIMVGLACSTTARCTSTPPTSDRWCSAA
jgi:uncharacterized membrane protein